MSSSKQPVDSKPVDSKLQKKDENPNKTLKDFSNLSWALFVPIVFSILFVLYRGHSQPEKFLSSSFEPVYIPSHNLEWLQELESNTSMTTAAELYNHIGVRFGLLSIINSKNQMSGLYFSKAREYFQKSVESDPKFPPPHLNLALLLMKEAKTDQVHKALEKVKGFADKNYGGTIHLYQAYNLEFADKVTEAKSYFEKALELNSSIHEIYHTKEMETYMHLRAPRFMKVHSYRQTLWNLLLFEEFKRQFHEYDQNQNEDFLWSKKTPESYPGFSFKGGYAKQEEIEAAGLFLEQNGYVILRDFLHPTEVDLIAEHYDSGVIWGGFASFDNSPSQRHVTHNDRIGNWVMQYYTDLLSKIARRQLKHSYDFLCYYDTKTLDKKPVLNPHTDREDNDYTVSVQILQKDVVGNVHWPIYVAKAETLPPKAGWQQKPNKEACAEASLFNGDALLFRGRTHTHFREPMPETISTYASLLLHYVRHEFDLVDYQARKRIDPTI